MGYMNSEIAEQLTVAESTVKSHLSSAFTKLGVKSRHEAVDLILDSERGLGMGILGIGGEPIEACRGAVWMTGGLGTRTSRRRAVRVGRRIRRQAARSLAAAPDRRHGRRRGTRPAPISSPTGCCAARCWSPTSSAFLAAIVTISLRLRPARCR